MILKARFIQMLWMLAGLGMVACSSSQEVKDGTRKIKITGEFDTSQKGLVSLREAFPAGDSSIDTTIQLSGKTFEFEVSLEEADFYVLNILRKREVLIVADKQNVHFKIDTQSGSVQFEVEGSPGTEQNLRLEKIVADYKAEVTALRQQDVEAEDTTEARIALEEAYTKVQQKSVEQVKALIEEIMPSIVVVRAAQILDPNQELNYMQKLSARLNNELPDSKYTERFTQQITQLAEKAEGQRRLMTGKPAPEIALASPEGETIKLSSLKGKLVLVDFWASWCKPCRAENPNVVKMYNQYKDKGLEIYGVSIDQDREAWLKAIKDDELSWVHVSDLQFWQSPVIQEYQIRAIPSTYLISREGNIIAKNLRGKALEEKVAELLN